MALKISGEAFRGAVVRGDFAELADDKRADVGASGFVVLRVDSVVTDHRVGHGDDLAAVRWVGDDLLVAGHGGIEADFSGGCSCGSVGNSGKAASVFEGENGGGGHGAGEYVSRARDGTLNFGKGTVI